MVAPLTDLLRAKVKFVWYPHCEQAFFNVKALLCSTPVLLAPRLEQPFKLLVDASRIGAGGILLQTDGQGINRPVSLQWALYLQPYNLDICLMCLLPCSLQSAVPPLKMLLGPKAADLDAELRTGEVMLRCAKTGVLL